MCTSLFLVNPSITLIAVIYFGAMSFILLSKVTPSVKSLASLNGDLAADTRKLKCCNNFLDQSARASLTEDTDVHLAFRSLPELAVDGQT